MANIRAAHPAWLWGLLAAATVGCKPRVDIDGERLKTAGIVSDPAFRATLTKLIESW